MKIHKPKPMQKIEIIDTANDTVGEKLGISKERGEVLKAIISSCLKKTTLISEDFLKFQEGARHINELVYMVWLYGQAIGYSKALRISPAELA